MARNEEKSPSIRNRFIAMKNPRLLVLNDEINKLLREKLLWERRIIELGGPDYGTHSDKITDLNGNIIDLHNPSGRGYRYFGAAKKLPGAKEMFDKPPELEESVG